MDHSDLISELAIIEKLTPAERIQLARERRALQLLKWKERDRASQLETAQPARTARVLFSPEIALLEATVRNDAEEVQNLLSRGANPNSRNEDGLTPLHQCAIDNNVEILVLLLNNKADVNAKDTELWTPLHAAACCAHVEVVRHLIERGADLLAVNADGNMPYDICDEEGTLDVIESEMASRGITQEDIDEERGSAEKRMLIDMKWLYQHGASLDYRELDGATPLHVASANGYYDVAAFLLRCKVSPTIKDDDSWQPVHAAACWAQPDIIELLDEYGADVNAKTDAGETPLDLCEDETTRAVILTLQAEKARRRRMAFPRDSRRYSKNQGKVLSEIIKGRKSISKFESPQAQMSPPSDSPFSARGAIRRLSLRDRSGVTLARIEARKEQAELMRSWSLEDTSQPVAENGSSEIKADGSKSATESPKKSNMKPVALKSGKQENETGKRKKKNPKSMSPDEWLKKLDEEEGKDRNTDVPETPKGSSLNYVTLLVSFQIVSHNLWMAPKRGKGGPKKRVKGSKDNQDSKSQLSTTTTSPSVVNELSLSNPASIGTTAAKDKKTECDGPNGVSSHSATRRESEPKKFRAPDDTIVGPTRRTKRFMCCTVL